MRAASVVLWAMLTWLLLGCQVLSQPLPTLIPTAAPPLVPVQLAAAPALPITGTEHRPGVVAQPTATVPTTVYRTAITPSPPHPLTPSVTATPLPTFLPPLLPSLTPTAPPTRPADEAPAYVAPPHLVDCDSTGFIFSSYYPSVAGASPYLAYLPPCYGSDGRVYPVLYLLHGSAQSESHWLDLGLAHYLDAGIASGRFPAAVAIMPNYSALGYTTSGGHTSAEGMIVSGLIPYVDANFCSWPSAAGRAIGGISRGGYWALEIAFQHPGLFRGVSGHSSHLRYATDGPAYNPLSTYLNGAGLRIWLDWGEEDFLREGQEQLHAALNGAGILHRATVNSGGHNDAYWRDHLDEYLAWHLASWPVEREVYAECERSEE